MRYGLIGEKLPHSYSKTIHTMLGRYEYELLPMSEDEMRAFMTAADFDGINVTIPYKEKVIPYLYHIDEGAKRIGAVNTVVNRGGRLYGYNTDCFGVKDTLRRAGFEIAGRKVAVLGTGGTSKTASYVCRQLGAGVACVSRTPDGKSIGYGELEAYGPDVIVNATPVGMYPQTGRSPVPPEALYGVSGVFDVIYNPLRTSLMLDAQERGIPAAGGLYMLVSQAMRAAELFTGEPVSDAETERIYKTLLSRTENIVLTGMPGSGKTSVGRAVAEKTGRAFYDTDALIAEKAGPVPDYIREHGEAAFRDLESAVIVELVFDTRGAVIATGGGAVLRHENVRCLKENGRIFYLQRDIEKIVPDGSRPLSSDREALRRRYEERKEIYEKTADVRIDCNGTVAEAADAIAAIVGA
ncbi:MAG: shikimate dehydrogenase [Clostridia bacterium]|nr:shikimate dehydrogenase [Clostridia bacterium]